MCSHTQWQLFILNLFELLIVFFFFYKERWDGKYGSVWSNWCKHRSLCCVTGKLLRLTNITESFSNDNGEGNESVQTAIG